MRIITDKKVSIFKINLFQVSICIMTVFIDFLPPIQTWIFYIKKREKQGTLRVGRQ